MKRRVPAFALCLLLCPLLGGSAEPKGTLVHMIPFVSAERPTDAALAEGIRRSLTDELSRAGFRVRPAVGDSLARQIAHAKAAGSAFVIGGQYRKKPNSNLELYGQLYNPDSGFLIDAYVLEDVVGDIKADDLDRKDLLMEDRERMRLFSRAMARRLLSNPGRKVRAGNIDEFVHGSGLSRAILRTLPLPTQSVEGRAREVFEILGEETVSIAARTSQRQEEAPATVSVVSRRHARENLRLTLFEMLERVPGITPMHTTNGDRVLVIRGVHSLDGALIMIDGVPVNDPLDGGFSFFQIPASMIEKVEIIRGPGSALYGGYALVGVVNIITRSARSLGPGTKQASYRSLGGISDRLSNGSAGKVGGEAAYRRRWNDYHAAFSLGFLQNESEDRRIFSDRTDERNRRGEVQKAAEFVIGPEGLLRRESFRNLNLQAKVGGADWDLVTVAAIRRIDPFYSYENSTHHDDRYTREDQLYQLSLVKRLQIRRGLIFAPKVSGVLIRRETSGDVTGRLAHGTDPESPNAPVGAEIWSGGKFETREHTTSSASVELEVTWKTGDTNLFTMGAAVELVTLGGVRNAANFRSPGRDDAFKTELALYDPADPTFQTTIVRDLTETNPWIAERSNLAQVDFDRVIRRRILSAFLQDVWRPVPWFSAVAGARYSLYSDFGEARTPFGSRRGNEFDVETEQIKRQPPPALPFSPRLGLVLSPKPFYFKALYGSAFKPPSFIQLFDQTVVESQGRTQLRGNAGLEPTTIQTAELTAGFRPNREWHATVTGFYYLTENEIALNQTLRKWQNLESRTGRGAEAELLWTTKVLQVATGYSYYKTVGIKTGTGAPLYPRFRYMLELRVALSGYDLVLGAVHRAGMRREETTQVQNTGDFAADWLLFEYNRSLQRPDLPPTTNLEVGVTKRITSTFDFFARVSNLLDAKIVDPTPEEFRIPGDIPRSSRTVWAGVRGTF